MLALPFVTFTFPSCQNLSSAHTCLISSCKAGQRRERARRDNRLKGESILNRAEGKEKRNTQSLGLLCECVCACCIIESVPPFFFLFEKSQPLGVVWRVRQLALPSACRAAKLCGDLEIFNKLFGLSPPPPFFLMFPAIPRSSYRMLLLWWRARCRAVRKRNRQREKNKQKKYRRFSGSTKAAATSKAKVLTWKCVSLQSVLGDVAGDTEMGRSRVCMRCLCSVSVQVWEIKTEKR